MPRKKEQPKPLSPMRFEFIESLEHVCGQAMMLLQAVDSVLQHGGLKPAVAEILAERSKALRVALIGED